MSKSKPGVCLECRDKTLQIPTTLQRHKLKPWSQKWWENKTTGKSYGENFFSAPLEGVQRLRLQAANKQVAIKAQLATRDVPELQVTRTLLEDDPKRLVAEHVPRNTTQDEKYCLWLKPHLNYFEQLKAQRISWRKKYE